MIIKRADSYGVRVQRAGRKVWIGTYPTLKEARKAEAAARTSSIRGTQITCAELAELWHEQHTRHKEASTRGNYTRATNQFNKRAGHKRAAAITRIEAQAFANDHARSTVDSISTMFEWARRAELVDANPFDGVTRVQTAPKVKPKILTDDEVRQLAQTAIEQMEIPFGEEMAAMVLFAAGTMMRPSEIFALRWADIDITAGRVAVGKSLAGNGELKLPKNNREREAPLLSLAREGLALLTRRDPDALVFTSNTGAMLSRSKLAYRWHELRGLAGLGKMRFYDLRHTGATRLLEMGAYSYEVAYALGHQDGGRLVERTYGHPQVERALDRIAELDAVANQERQDDEAVA